MAQPRVAIRLGTEGKDQVVRDFTLIEQLVMIAATLISGIILFYLIEERFRRPVATESNSPLSGAAFGFASAGFALVLTFPWPFFATLIFEFSDTFLVIFKHSSDLT